MSHTRRGPDQWISARRAFAAKNSRCRSINRQSRPCDVAPGSLRVFAPLERTVRPAEAGLGRENSVIAEKSHAVDVPTENDEEWLGCSVACHDAGRCFDANWTSARARIELDCSLQENTMSAPSTPRIVDRGEWNRARRALLAREQAHTRAGDEIAAARRPLPMTPGTKSRSRVQAVPFPSTRCSRVPGHSAWYFLATSDRP